MLMILICFVMLYVWDGRVLNEGICRIFVEVFGLCLIVIINVWIFRFFKGLSVLLRGMLFILEDCFFVVIRIIICGMFCFLLVSKLVVFFKVIFICCKLLIVCIRFIFLLKLCKELELLNSIFVIEDVL